MRWRLRSVRYHLWDREPFGHAIQRSLELLRDLSQEWRTRRHYQKFRNRERYAQARERSQMNKAQAKVMYVKMFLIMAILSKLFETVVYHAADLSLWGNQYAAPLGLPLPVRSEYNPEGVLWFRLNPFQWGLWQYAVYTFVWDMSMLAVQMVLVKKGKLPLELVAFNQVSSIIWYWGWGKEVQNITVTSIMPFMFLIPEIGVLSILQKFPIGWYPVLNNPHVDCMLHCAFGNLELLYLFRAINYTIILVLFLDPLLARWRKGQDWFPIIRWVKKVKRVKKC